MSTQHKGKAKVVNHWGIDLASLTLRHRRSNNPDLQEEVTWYNVSSGDTTSGMSFIYETGAGSPFDYWWVSFVTINGHTYGCKDNFYCSVSSDDDLSRRSVILTLDGASREMRVDLPTSSDCTVSISKVD
jgi:hypothetical protein